MNQLGGSTDHASLWYTADRQIDNQCLLASFEKQNKHKAALAGCYN